MNRQKMIAEIENPGTNWDFVIIGGGATGVGTAIEAASRGYKVLLVEQSDFGKATSSRSTKLVHGGVRYLRQGNISLVLDALKERSIMRRNAPHLVHDRSFIIPVYHWWEGPFYWLGLKLYDWLAGKESFGPSKLLSKEDTLKHIPTIEQKGLRGGVIYHDGQFDDARMLINMVQTAAEQGATLLNYAKATGIIKRNSLINGIEIIDLETNSIYKIHAKVVINATGVFADSIRRMDDPGTKNRIKGSQGVHIVLDKSFLPGDSAIMVPRTSDGRVLFALPWHNKTLVGTTDTLVEGFSLEPRAKEEEIEFLISHAAKYLTKDPVKSDVKSVFVGLRALVKSKKEKNTSAISRDHMITISNGGLVTITGGKWTTYRKMAEEAVDRAAILVNLKPKSSITKNLRIHGYHTNASVFKDLAIYGADASSIQQLINEDETYKVKLHPEYPTVAGEVIWAVRYEMARNIEDFLARRSRLLLLDARASLEAAPKVAEFMARELNKDEKWIRNQLSDYQMLVLNYLIG